MLGDSGAALVVTDAALGARLPPAHAGLVVPADELTEGATGPAPDLWPGLRRRTGDPAHLLYTSGTTGRPQGAIHTHANLLVNAGTMRERLGAGPEERTLIAAPMFHATGVVSQFVGFATPEIHFVDELPRNPSGKVLKRQLHDVRR